MDGFTKAYHKAISPLFSHTYSIPGSDFFNKIDHPCNIFNDVFSYQILIQNVSKFK
jgi:hypothetical protein